MHNRPEFEGKLCEPAQLAGRIAALVRPLVVVHRPPRVERPLQLVVDVAEQDEISAPAMAKIAPLRFETAMVTAVSLLPLLSLWET